MSFNVFNFSCPRAVRTVLRWSYIYIFRSQVPSDKFNLNSRLQREYLNSRRFLSMGDLLLLAPPQLASIPKFCCTTIRSKISNSLLKWVFFSIRFVACKWLRLEKRKPQSTFAFHILFLKLNLNMAKDSIFIYSKFTNWKICSHQIRPIRCLVQWRKFVFVLRSEHILNVY